MMMAPLMLKGIIYIFLDFLNDMSFGPLRGRGYLVPIRERSCRKWERKGDAGKKISEKKGDAGKKIS